MKLRIPRLLPRQILSLPFICGHTCNISTASYSTPSQNPGSADTSPYRPSWSASTRRHTMYSPRSDSPPMILCSIPSLDINRPRPPPAPPLPACIPRPPPSRPPRRRRRGTAPCPPGGAGGVPPRGPPRGPVVRSAGGAAGGASAAAREARGEDR
ncbi:hypothetical protein B0H14DRAFT_1611039 [Mycena olivaceomarginata]|nr:hypothetical protein B0H14DRAFT_1611039 [Mycena olivaceomarginata]